MRNEPSPDELSSFGSFSRPVNIAESAAFETAFPFRWQPLANGHRVEVRFYIDAFVLAEACVSLSSNAFVAA
jgi:hypothetical protein